MHDATCRSSSENRTHKLRRQQRDDAPAGYVWERADLARTDAPFGVAQRETLAACENDAMSKVARARRLRARQGPHSEQSIKRQPWQLAGTAASPSPEMLGGAQLPGGREDVLQVLQGGNLGRGADSPAPKEWYTCMRACVRERERERERSRVAAAGSRTSSREHSIH